MGKTSKIEKRNDTLLANMPATIDLDILHDAVDLVIFKGLHVINNIIEDDKADNDIKLKAISGAINAGKYATERKVKTIDVRPQLDLGDAFELKVEKDDEKN